MSKALKTSSYLVPLMSLTCAIERRLLFFSFTLCDVYTHSERSFWTTDFVRATVLLEAGPERSPNACLP